jgi:hypothetical protein
MADERFYSTVDAQGRVQVLKSEVVTTPSKQSTKESAVSLPSNTSLPKTSAESSSTAEGYRQLDAETYVDVELLEKKNFNLEDKKRFYYVPTIPNGTALIQTESGQELPVTPVIPTLSKAVLSTSSSYQLISSQEVQSLYPKVATCYSAKYLKKNAKDLDDTYNVWKSPAFDKTIIPDRVLKLSTQSKALRLVSFANSMQKPSFYLPVVVFLDVQGCTLTGVWQYWNYAQPASEKQYASVAGLLNVPEQSAYVIFYEPPSSLVTEIPMQRHTGSFVIEIY